MLRGVLSVVFLVVAAVNAAVAVADAVLWPVVMAVCCATGAAMVGRVSRPRGRGLDTAQRIVTEGLGSLPARWPDHTRSRDVLAADDNEPQPRDG